MYPGVQTRPASYRLKARLLHSDRTELNTTFNCSSRTLVWTAVFEYTYLYMKRACCQVSCSSTACHLSTERRHREGERKEHRRHSIRRPKFSIILYSVCWVTFWLYTSVTRPCVGHLMHAVVLSCFLNCAFLVKLYRFLVVDWWIK